MISYFVHATSTDNETDINSGWSNVSLSELGLQQAAELGKLLAHQNFDVVFTSDLLRAVQTAEIAFPLTRIEQDVRLREMNYGLLNGQVAGHFPEDPLWCIENRFEQGECCLDVQKQIEAFLVSHYKPGTSIAIVSHRYPQLAFEVICKGISWQEAIQQDWRLTGSWQAGWDYRLPTSSLFGHSYADDL